MGRIVWIIIVVTIGALMFFGCESSGPTGDGGGGGGGGPYPSLGGDWDWQYPLPQGNDLLAVDFVNSYLGLAVGKGGIIIRTTNGGTSWNAISPITSYTLSDVKFADQETAFAIGYGDLPGQTAVLRTVDGGVSWSIANPGGNGAGEVIAIGSANVIYLGGETTSGNGYFCRTTNAGNSWNSITTTIDAGITGLYFVEEGYGFAACNDGTIYLTFNGGDNWGQAIGTSDHPFTNIAFYDTLIQNGWATAGTPYPTAINNEQLFVSSYNGEIWNGVNLPWVLSLQSISMPTINTIVVGGYQVISGITCVPVIIISDDGGQHWTRHQLQLIAPDVNMVADVDFISDEEGWLVGPSNFIAHTDNAGTSFDLQSQIGVSDWELLDVEFVDEDLGWAVGITAGDSALSLYTTNGGNSWLGGTLNISHPFRAISSPQSNMIWTASDSGKVYELSSISSLNWLEHPTGSIYTLNDIHMKNDGSGWAVGDMGTLLATTEGNVWTPVDLGTTEDLRCLEFANDTVGFVAGDGGAFFRTIDGGQNWSSLDAPADYNFVALSFVNPDTGWAGTTNGQVLRTYDGGSNLENLTNVGGGMIHDIKFINSIYGFICGPDGMIWSSTDRGNLWVQEITGTNLNLNRLTFRGNSEGWVVGDGAAILHWIP